jgi:hypothetical protein
MSGSRVPIVYLDSSDISGMAEGREERWRAVRRRLRHAVDLGLIEIRFSVVHIMEVQPLDIVFSAAREHIRDSLLARPNRKLRRSDGGDLFHFAYIPYVDWFRCDGHMSNLAGPIAKRHGTLVLSKIGELMSRLPPGEVK